MDPCQVEPETFWTLVRSAAHWELEVFIVLLVDGLIGALIWPYVRRHWLHHLARDRREGQE